VELKIVDPAGVLKTGAAPPFFQPSVKLDYIWPADGLNGFTLRPGETYKVRIILDVNRSILDSDWSNNAITVIWHMTP